MMSVDRNAIPAPPPASRPATVLIVDDEDGVRRLLAHWVKSLGYTSRTADDAVTAMEMMKSMPVDVAVCDLRMPGRDGVWLIDQIQKESPSTAVVIATGLPEMAATVQSSVAGCLIKPFQRRDLATVLSHALAPDNSLGL
jgi:DNA-binding NtrC family response regulator